MQIPKVSGNQPYEAATSSETANSKQKISDRLSGIDVNKVNELFNESLEGFQANSNATQASDNAGDCRWDQFGRT